MSVFSNDDSALSIREDKARRNSQEALNFLVNDYRSMASIMRQYYPLAILSRAAWRCYEVENGHRPDELALARARILPMLLQSIFTSRYYDREGGFSSRQEILTKDWHRLETLADDAVRRLVRLIECRAVLAVKEGHVASSDFVAYRERLFLQLFGYSASRSDLEESRFLFESVFVDDEEMVEQVFQSDSRSLVGDLTRICFTMMDGIGELVAQTKRLNDEIRDKVVELQGLKPELTHQLAVDEVVAKGGYKPRLEALGARADGYDLFSVEHASLMSSATCRLFSADASSLDDVMEDGFLTAALHPFIRFADRYYCFLGPSLYSFITHAIRSIMQRSGVKPSSSSKIDKLFSHFVLLLFRQSDIEDVYTYKGYKIDVIRLSSLRYVNAYLYPEVFETRMERRRAEEAIRPALGHAQLFVDPDSFSPLEQVGDSSWRISLTQLAKVCSSDEGSDEFLRTVFHLDEREDFESGGDFDDVFTEEVDDTSSWDAPLDDVPPQLLSDDEGEYDRTDDDEKARILEARFDAEEALPPCDDSDLPSSRPVDDISQYELPEGMEDEPVTEQFEDLESDDFQADDAPSVDDDADIGDEGEELSLLDDETMYDEDDGLDDDPIVDEEEDEVLDDEEEYVDDGDVEDDVCYVPDDDPDQLMLFDEDGNPAHPYDGRPDVDDLVAADSIDEDIDDLALEDGAMPSDDGQNPVQPDSAPCLDDDQADSAQDGGDSLDGSSDGYVEDLCDVPCANDEVVEADEEEEADEADDDLPAACDDDPVEEYDSSEAQLEEACLASEPSEESQEAEEEEEMLALCAGADDEDSAGDMDVIQEHDASYAGEAEYGKAEDDVDDGPSSGVDAGDENPFDGLPDSITGILRAMDRPLPAFVSFIENADDDTLRALDDTVRKAATASRSEGRDKMLVIPSSCLSLIVTGSERFDDLRRMEIRNNAGAQMYARDASSWSFALLGYDTMERLSFTWCDEISPDSFSASDWKIVKVLGEEIRKGGHR